MVGSTNHLLGNHDYSLDAEPATAVVEEVFERGTEQIDHEDVVETLLAEVVNIGDTRATDEDLVRSVLISQLGRVAFARFEFDGNLLVVQEIRPLEDNAK